MSKEVMAKDILQVGKFTKESKDGWLNIQGSVL
jgi:hypothetical protein